MPGEPFYENEREIMEKLHIVENYPIDFDEFFSRHDPAIDNLLASREKLTQDQVGQILDRYLPFLENSTSHKDPAYKVLFSLVGRPTNTSAFVEKIFNHVSYELKIKMGKDIPGKIMTMEMIKFHIAHGDDPAKYNLQKTLSVSQLKELVKDEIIDGDYVVSCIYARIDSRSKLDMTEQELLSFLEVAHEQHVDNDIIEVLENQIADWLLLRTGFLERVKL